MNFKKILIINPYGIGDVLFTTPVIGNLRLAYPQAVICYLANKRTAGMLKCNPDIAKVFVYERDEFVGNYPKYFKLFKSINQERFDLVLDFSLNSSFGFLSFACGIKKRVGFDYRKRGFFLTDRVPLLGYEDKHVVEYYLDLLRQIEVPVKSLPMRLDVPDAETQWAKQWLEANHVDRSKKLIAVFPGGGASWGKAAGFKRWSAPKYAELIDIIIEKFDAVIILMGDPKEEVLCREVARLARFPVQVAAGASSLLGSAALLKLTQGAVVNDGGPLHMAVAAGVKTAAIFGPVDPRVYGPYPVGAHRVVQKGLPCQPCYRRFRMASCGHINCLGELSVQEVYRKVEQIL